MSAPASPQNVSTNQVTVAPNINVSQNTMVMVNQTKTGPGILARVIWFVFIGWWLGLIATYVGYLLCLTVILLPVGLTLLNRLPVLITLRPAAQSIHVSMTGNVTTINIGGTKQYNFLLRAFYFLFVGWWFTLLWLNVAWLFMALGLVTLGLTWAPAFMMFDRVPAALTLRRN